MAIEESDLIRRAQGGDVDAFEQLIEAHQAALFRMIRAITANVDDAEDALQETLLHAHRALPRFRGDASLSTWLHRIALNTTRNWLRSQTRASSERIGRRLARVGAEPEPRPEEELLARERRAIMRDAILKLPDHYRDAILLRHYRDMSYADIGQVLGIPVGTVRSRIAQGRRLLLEELEKSGYFARPEPR